MRPDDRSERQYLRFLREIHIADIGPQPPADAELDRNDDDIVALQIIGSEAADEIELALDLRKALAQTLGVVKRSEEHTSELQSLMRISYAVVCLKKKHKSKYKK